MFSYYGQWFYYITSLTFDSTLQTAFDKKTIPQADDGKSFDSCVDAVRAVFPTEFSVITSAVSFCISVAGCGVCKRMQPIFQQAATETKGKYVSLLNLLPAHLLSCLSTLTVSNLQPFFSDVCRLDEICK